MPRESAMALARARSPPVCNFTHTFSERLRCDVRCRRCHASPLRLSSSSRRGRVFDRNFSKDSKVKSNHLLSISVVVLTTLCAIASATARSPLRANDAHCTPASTPHATYDLPVVGVSDGDTLKVVFPRSAPTPGEQRVRLVEIDAPESSQAYGKAAKKALSSLAFGRRVTLIVRGNDRFCRPLAEVYVGSQYVNLDLVRHGFAWANREFGRDPRFRDAERNAKRERVGLWADTNPTYPGDYRRSGANHVRG